MASGTFYASGRIAATTAVPLPSAHPLAVIKPHTPTRAGPQSGCFFRRLPDL